MRTFITLIFISSLSYVTSVFNFEELQSLHYGIDISDTPLLRQEPMPPDAIVLASKYGQIYQCSYQPPPALNDGTSDSMQPGNLSVVELLAPMKQASCLVFNKGWWTYEFCFGQEVKQYHSEDGKVVGDVLSLGHFEKDLESPNVNSEKLKSEMQHGRRKPVEPRYYRQAYINGTLCDLTGKARSAEARFVCQEGHGDYVASIDERETCSYVVTVHTSRICSHPQFGPLTSAQSVTITCSPLLSSSEYESYISDLKTSATEVQQKIESSSAGGKSEEDASASLTANSGTEKGEANHVGSKSTDDFEKLFFDSLVQGVREALNGQEQKQTSAPDELVKIVNDGSDFDSILKSMLGDEQSSDETEDATSKRTSSADSKSSVAHITPTDSTMNGEPSKDKYETSEDTMEDDEDDADMDDEDKEFLHEFDKGLDKIAPTTSEKAGIAKYRDSIHSAMSAMLPSLVQEEQEEMARQGEDAAVDAQAAFRKLAKTLNSLIERLEHAAKDFDEDEEEDATKEKPKKQKTVETEESLSKHSKVSSVDRESKVKETEDSHESMDGKVRFRVRLTDKTSPETEPGIDDSLPADQQRPAAKQEPTAQDDTTPHSTRPLASRLKDQLEQAGLKTAGRKIEFRIVTAGFYDNKDGTLHTLSDDESSAVNKMIIAIIGGSDDEETKEMERQQRLEDNYQFKFRLTAQRQKEKPNLLQQNNEQ